MAQQALGTGMIVPRRRVLFGLLDSDSWAWATVKAFVWLVIIILLLGYIPDRAYYFTVNRTIELGVNAWSPVNLCSSENESLPCPAPRGAVVAWHQSPPELALKAARTQGSAIQLGSKILYIGGSDGQTAQKDVWVAPIAGIGNFDKWADGPALPEARADASVVAVSGTVYVIGGLDADGAPTKTVFALTPDPKTGALGEWKKVDALALQDGRAGAAAVAAPDGLLLIGGENADGPVTTTFKSLFDTKGVLQKWSKEADLARPQSDALAAVIGDFVWLYGGHDQQGPVGAVQRGSISQEAPEGYPKNPDQGKVTKWDIDNGWNLPGARDDPAGWNANGALYVVGGADNDGLRRELYWTIPSNDGVIAEWKHLDASDLATASKGGSAFVTGPNAVITGGETDQGVLSTSVRANTAPQSPFFQLGLVGATVPGLKIDGEIGQQLGYLNAAGAGTVDFIVLLLIGWAFAHQAQARSIMTRVVRRRRRT
jgi:N-acetylneuraminic acid mutarotase